MRISFVFARNMVSQLRLSQIAWNSLDVKAFTAALDAAIKGVGQLLLLTADLEFHTRQICGGGSVSSRLFIGETLHSLQIEGKKAWAVRDIGAGHTEVIGFIRRGENWYIRLFARRR